MDEPLSLHPENPHYFIYNEKPTVLITSGEHYGAVINVDFNYKKYLETLYNEGLNHTRLFVGVYREFPNDYWPKNTLGPEPGRFVCPFARSNMPGALDGGNKFDLDKWDDIFFARLNDFCKIAQDYGIVIEINLFCPFYVNHHGDGRWKISPWYHVNNINDIGEIPVEEVFTFKHPKLLKYQENMVKKIVNELNNFNNIYYEICNEPYWDIILPEWQDHMADIIVDVERDLPKKHLISYNIANGSKEVKNPYPYISIFNFHYPRRAKCQCVPLNYHLNKVIGCNETGFNGSEEEYYRVEAWQFMLSGGALYNNLDISFYAGGGEECLKIIDGTKNFCGGTIFRKQIKILKDFIEKFDFIRMSPANDIIETQDEDIEIYVLAEKGKQYGIHIFCKGKKQCESIGLKIPNGKYLVEYINVIKGEIIKSEQVIVINNKLNLKLPFFNRDIAVKIVVI